MFIYNNIYRMKFLLILELSLNFSWKSYQSRAVSSIILYCINCLPKEINFLFKVGDRLFSALGQDTIDALFWTATEPRGRKREHIGVLAHFLLTIIYVILHTLLVLLQATTLNVAINASNKALLTIMMSNNVRAYLL